MIYYLTLLDNHKETPNQALPCARYSQPMKAYLVTYIDEGLKRKTNLIKCEITYNSKNFSRTNKKDSNTRIYAYYTQGEKFNV